MVKTFVLSVIQRSHLNKTDGKGNLVQTFTINDLAGKLVGEFNGTEYNDEYTVVRIIDKCGQSGGLRIKQEDPNAPPRSSIFKERDSCNEGKRRLWRVGIHPIIDFYGVLLPPAIASL